MPLPKSPKWVSGLRPTQEQGSNPKDELGMLKAPLALVSPVAIAIEALCMADGSEKYGPYNPRVSKVQAFIYIEACLRHIYALLDGEDFDPKTGKPHLGYARATLGIYCDAWINGMLIDNRPLPGKTNLLLALMERTPGQPELTPGEITEGLLRIVNAPIPSSPSTNPPELHQPVGERTPTETDVLRVGPQRRKSRSKVGPKARPAKTR